MDAKKIVNLFKEQRDPITNILSRSIDFIAVEHQHTIIDGNHVSPDLSDNVFLNNPGVLLVEAYLSVSDLDVHRKMMMGPTHNRFITDLDFKTARILHDFLVSEAKERGRPVFEYNKGIENTLALIESKLAEVVCL